MKGDTLSDKRVFETQKLKSFFRDFYDFDLLLKKINPNLGLGSRKAKKGPPFAFLGHREQQSLSLATDGRHGGSLDAVAGPRACLKKREKVFRFFN